MVETRERGPDPGDRTILQWADAEGRILVTMDKDFGQFLFVENAPHCGLIRLPDEPSAKRIELIKGILSKHAVELKQRAVITILGERIRITHTHRET